MGEALEGGKGREGVRKGGREEEGRREARVTLQPIKRFCDRKIEFASAPFFNGNNRRHFFASLLSLT